jgi:hypothetical protein
VQRDSWAAASWSQAQYNNQKNNPRKNPDSDRTVKSTRMLADKIVLNCGEADQQVQVEERNGHGQDVPNQKPSSLHREEAGKPKGIPGAGQEIQDRNLRAFGDV